MDGKWYYFDRNNGDMEFRGKGQSAMC
ncbi:hypothetical protein [Enterocloster bolteae]|nr:hypothetical protein [Enterocloster bolteae]MDU1138098.1 hypothetical protein [Enterocloster bolteae]